MDVFLFVCGIKIIFCLESFMVFCVGGSEQFQDKRKFFNSELRSHHSKEPRGERHLHIDRFNLLQSVSTCYIAGPSISC